MESIRNQQQHGEYSDKSISTHNNKIVYCTRYFGWSTSGEYHTHQPTQPPTIENQQIFIQIFDYFKTIEFSVKSGKHSTKTLSLVQNKVRFKKNLQKCTLAFKGEGRGGGTFKRAIFGGKHSFILFWPPSLFPFPERLHCLLLHIFSLLLPVQLL